MHCQVYKRITFCLLGLLLLSSSAVHAQVGLRDLDAYIERALQDWDVPGLALAIVRNDSIVHARGYGVREVGRPAPVDEHTMFAIGSNAKAFTAATVGLLVQEGELSWDDPVVKYLPTLQLADPYATQHLTLRDVLAHRSGLSGGDLLTLTDYSREDILRRIRYLQPSQSFRNGPAYGSILYLAASEVVRSIAGVPWEQFVDERLFRPLGMRRTTADARELERFDNVASPHLHIDGTLRPIPYRKVNNMAPAGGIISSAADMTHWLTMLINDGRYNDTTLLNSSVVRELRAPQMIFRTELAPGTFPSAHLAASALGWFVQDYHDRLVVWHTGGAAGMSSTVGLVPEDGVAVVVLTNTLLNGLHTAAFWRAIDACLGLPERDWSAEALQQWRDPAAWVAMREEQLRGRRDESARSSVPLRAFVGV